MLCGAKWVYQPGSKRKTETRLVFLTERPGNCFASIQQQEVVTAESGAPKAGRTKGGGWGNWDPEALRTGQSSTPDLKGRD